jgi:hypothetical protein
MTCDDRLLVLLDGSEMPIERWAAGCESLSGIGTIDQVRAARRQFAGLENAMFTPGSRQEIPWADMRFSVIVDRSGAEPTLEMMRVLVEGGRIVSDPE